MGMVIKKLPMVVIKIETILKIWLDEVCLRLALNCCKFSFHTILAVGREK